MFATIAQAQPVPGNAEPANDPSTWITPADYPPEALAAQVQGLVGFKLDIAPEGAVTKCTIIASSSSSALDAQTCALLTIRARFGRQNVRAGDRQFVSRIRWTLPREQLADPRTDLAPINIPSTTTIGYSGSELVVGGDGIIFSCAPLPRRFDNVLPPPDLCSTYRVGMRYGPPTLRNGHPARRKVRIEVEVTSTPLPR